MYLLFSVPPCPVCSQRVSAVDVFYLMFASRPRPADLFRVTPCGHEFERRDQHGWVGEYEKVNRRSEVIIVPVAILLLVALMLGLVLVTVAVV